MNYYPFIKPLLFKLDAEVSHYLTLKGLKISHIAGLDKLLNPAMIAKPVTVMGLEFANPVGLAAGLDKNGDYIDALATLGFGSLEIGTVTPRPQPGNPKRRLFRLAEHQAIINRMGFNNYGVDYLLEQVNKSKYQGVIGINIGKNFDTPIDKATKDYLICLRKAYLAASYITINISSPNTKNLRQLQQGDEIKRLLFALKEEQMKLEKQYNKYTPIVVKIAPDLSDEEIQHIAGLLIDFSIDGVIATNTTLERKAVQGHLFADEMGGLSGAPLKRKSTYVVARLSDALKGKLPIIAVGGILSYADAQEKLDAGASLVQLYSGLIYKGPLLVDEIMRGLTAK
ncbi:MAG TPA: quinone-dependent dihydroorotate dehydrogenase [Methyloprofundus sp.]|uniref:quinone-dependent dihydroorotate dehydrogenase n=1 Tax=Methyloprofundus sp. TaxID=2020875 RepID=UPI00185A93C9|nr:quinone-dependent dihydroorotate dehydrogenase [Methyloprofundus sp.]HIG64148.1 quinone-dependent dihydroorotate dehydrogenase [Methyloprofundus sp.]HIL77328.1 quinone-dependent dihydroorotate dehydrogenase [Methylococcales bacterium]